MAMNTDLMLAILAMDSYNRGYGAGIKSIVGVIGNATVDRDSSVLLTNGQRLDIPAGFYAVAYNYAGGKVISYRGTDMGYGDSLLISLLPS